MFDILFSPDLTNTLVHLFHQVDTRTSSAVFAGIARILQIVFLKTDRNQLNYAWGEYFYALLLEVFLSLKVCWPRPASIVHTTEATMRLCNCASLSFILHLLYGFVGLPVAFFVVEQGAGSDLAAD